MNLFPLTPATSFFSGPLSLWVNDKMDSSFWNAWLNQGFPVTFQAISAKDLFITKGGFSLSGYSERLETLGVEKVDKMTLQEDLDATVEFAMLELSVLP